jgi:hypothetical protein
MSDFPHVGAAELAMNRRLFGADFEHVAPVDDTAMWETLRELRKSVELAPFRLFLVGSRLDSGNEARDIDLLLAPCAGFAFTDARIEGALFHCRDYGLHAKPPRLIDPCFRRTGPRHHVVPLSPTTILETAKLFSPRLRGLIGAGRITHFRRFGHFSIEYLRPACETGFYPKLPQRHFELGRVPYLRPAIEVTRNLSG